MRNNADDPEQGKEGVCGAISPVQPVSARNSTTLWVFVYAIGRGQMPLPA